MSKTEYAVTYGTRTKPLPIYRMFLATRAHWSDPNWSAEEESRANYVGYTGHLPTPMDANK